MSCLPNVTQQSRAHSSYQPSPSESQFVLLPSGYVALPRLLGKPKGMVSVAMRKPGKAGWVTLWAVSQRAPEENPASVARLRCGEKRESQLPWLHASGGFFWDRRGGRA